MHGFVARSVTPLSTLLATASALTALLTAPVTSAQVTVQPLLPASPAAKVTGANTGSGTASASLAPNGCYIRASLDAIALPGDEPAAAAAIPSSVCSWKVSFDAGSCQPGDIALVVPTTAHAFTLGGAWGAGGGQGVYAALEATATSLATTSSYDAVIGTSGDVAPTDFLTLAPDPAGGYVTTLHATNITSFASNADTETLLWGDGGGGVSYGIAQSLVGSPLTLACGESVMYSGEVSAFAEIQSLGDRESSFGGTLMGSVGITLAASYVIKSAAGASKPANAALLPPVKGDSAPATGVEGEAVSEVPGKGSTPLSGRE